MTAKPFSGAGIVFPDDGSTTVEKRSTTATSKTLLAAALNAGRNADAAKALEAQPSSKWRFGYQSHVRAVVETMGQNGGKECVAAAQAGLQAAQTLFRFQRDGEAAELSVRDAITPGRFTGTFSTGRVDGRDQSAVVGPRGITVPFNGKSYGGAALEELVDQWVAADQCEPSFAASVKEILRSESTAGGASWTDLRGKVFVLIGATSEMGPCEALLDCGATVVALARSGAKKWQGLLDSAAKRRGHLLFPCNGVGCEAAHAGADALQHTPEIINWLTELFASHPLCKGKTPHVYCGIYLDGGKFVRASVAMEAIVSELQARLPSRQRPALLYIDTPSHVHCCHAATLAATRRQQKACGLGAKLCAACGGMATIPSKTLAGDASTEDPTVLMDFLSSQQGPNYAVAKLLQRFRAIFSRHRGGSIWDAAKTGSDERQLVSITNGPAAKTESVMHSASMALMMNNMHRAPPNVAHEKDTVQVLLALVMLRDLASPTAMGNPQNDKTADRRHPMAFVVENAWHGGMWRSPYTLETLGRWAIVSLKARQVATAAAVVAAAVVVVRRFA